MPSRTRIVLRRKDGEPPITNESAKHLIASLVLETVLWKTGLPEGWAKLKLRGKLEYLKTLLPPEWVLEVYTEPRATRPTRSVYKSQFVRDGLIRKKARKTPTRLVDFVDEFIDTPTPVDPQPPQNQVRIDYDTMINWANTATLGTIRRP